MNKTECAACDGEGYLMVIDPDERMAVKQACGRCRGVGNVCELCIGTSDQQHPCSGCGVGLSIDHELYAKRMALADAYYSRLKDCPAYTRKRVTLAMLRDILEHMVFPIVGLSMEIDKSEEPALKALTAAAFLADEEIMRNLKCQKFRPCSDLNNDWRADCGRKDWDHKNAEATNVRTV